MVVRALAGDVYKFRPYPLKKEFGDDEFYDLGTHLYAPDIDSVLEMDPIGKPISIFEAYVLRCDHAHKVGFQVLNMPFGELIKGLGYYVKIEPGDVEPLRMAV